MIGFSFNGTGRGLSSKHLNTTLHDKVSSIFFYILAFLIATVGPVAAYHVNDPLADYSAIATGKVDSVESVRSRMKTRVFYTITFDVGARVYTTKPQKAQGLDGSSVAIGQEALVHYDPSDPRKSWVEGEKTPLAATIQFVFFLWAFAAAMVGITALAARSAKAEQAKRQAGVAEG